MITHHYKLLITIPGGSFSDVTDEGVADAVLTDAGVTDVTEKRCEKFVTVESFRLSLRSRLPSLPLITVITVAPSSSLRF